MNRAGSPRIACGLIESKGKLITLTCVEIPPSGTAKKLRAFLQKQVGVAAKVQLIGPGGFVEEDGEDDATDQGYSPEECWNYFTAAGYAAG